MKVDFLKEFSRKGAKGQRRKGSFIFQFSAKVEGFEKIVNPALCNFAPYFLCAFA